MEVVSCTFPGQFKLNDNLVGAELWRHFSSGPSKRIKEYIKFTIQNLNMHELVKSSDATSLELICNQLYTEYEIARTENSQMLEEIYSPAMI